MDEQKQKSKDEHGVITAGPKAHANEGAGKPDKAKAEAQAHNADRNAEPAKHA